MADLKPCPFCGGEAKKVVTAVFYNGTNWGYIRCGKPITACCVKQPEMLIEEAIKAWNRRTKVEVNFYDKEETYPNCTVQVLTNTVTGDVSVGWWKNGGNEDA